jgi:hypothetical protein
MYSLTLLIFPLDPYAGFPCWLFRDSFRQSFSLFSRKLIRDTAWSRGLGRIAHSRATDGDNGLEQGARIVGFRDHVYSKEIVAGKTYHPRLFLLITYIA